MLIVKRFLYKMLGSLLMVRTISYENAVAINGRSFTTIIVDLSISGFTPLAVMNLATYGTEVFSLGNVSIPASGQARITLWNNYSDSRTASAVAFKVLYRRS